MKKTYNEVKKFNILTNIRENPSLYAALTIPEIQQRIIKNFDTAVSSDSLYRWSKLYNFSYKPTRRPKALKPAEAIKQTNQRIHILGIVVRNVCKQLEISHPSMLDKLIDGITEQYGTTLGAEIKVKALEDHVYKTI